MDLKKLPYHRGRQLLTQVLLETLRNMCSITADMPTACPQSKPGSEIFYILLNNPHRKYPLTDFYPSASSRQRAGDALCAFGTRIQSNPMVSPDSKSLFTYKTPHIADSCCQWKVNNVICFYNHGSLSEQFTEACAYTFPPEKDRNFRKTTNEALEILPMISQVQQHFSNLISWCSPRTAEWLTLYSAYVENIN